MMSVNIPPALAKHLCFAYRMAILTGAGVSAESGVPEPLFHLPST